MRVPRSLPVLGALLGALIIAAPTSAATWGPIHTIASDGWLVDGRSLAVTGSVAHIVYTSGGNLIYRRSVNGGLSWGSQILLAHDAGSQKFNLAELSADGPHVFVLYHSYQGTGEKFWLRRSVNGGKSWKAAQLIASATGGDLGQAAIAVGGKYGYIYWTDRANGAIEARQSADDGATWNGPFTTGFTFVTNGGGAEGYVRAAASGARAYVAWIFKQGPDSSSGKGIVVRRTVNGGATWSNNLPLTPTTTVVQLQASFSLAASGKNLIASYTRKSAAVGIARSSDGGKSIHNANLPGTDAYQYHAVTLHGAAAKFVGQKYADNHLLERRSADGGATWSNGSDIATPSTQVGAIEIATGTKGDVVAWWQLAMFPFLPTPIRTRFASK